MCLNNLPPEVLYNIVATVVIDYIDCAIASPPHPVWFNRYPTIQIDSLSKAALQSSLIPSLSDSSSTAFHNHRSHAPMSTSSLSQNISKTHDRPTCFQLKRNLDPRFDSPPRPAIALSSDLTVIVIPFPHLAPSFVVRLQVARAPEPLTWRFGHINVGHNVLMRCERRGLGPIIIPIGSKKTEWLDFPKDKFNLIVLLALQVFGPDLTNAPLLPPSALDFFDRANKEDEDEWSDTYDDTGNEGSDIAPPTRQTAPSSQPAGGFLPWENPSATASSAAGKEDCVNAADMSDGSSTEEEFSDDEDNDSDIDDGEECRKFKAFKMAEKKELLPKNQITPLLGVNGYVRETTLRIINDTLGVKKKRGSKASIHKKIITVLRDLRWTYRIAHTPPFHCSDLVSAYKGPVTPFVDAYLGLSQAGYSAGLTDFGFQFILQTMKATRDIDLTIPQPVLRARVSQRAYIYHTRFRLWRRLVGHEAKIADAYEAAIQRTERRRLVFTVNTDKCVALQQALRNLVAFEEKYVTQEYFDVFPRVLIKMSGIRLILKHLDGLRVVNSIRENEAALAIVREATDVLKTWRRKCKAKTSFYVVLNSGIRKIWFEGGKVMESTIA
ncbi:hypothetical protein NLJ89_g704 [Agrocybe chaxingu]|uniref:Uncharacterized protein n=1 Tax=Agrocybe chaxingu TaxID=84603 RepID=A0A9W8N1F3_9AGAR|nr:hypothetical protein NLJ89_g704 [Agrocybe chaxingu]